MARRGENIYKRKDGRYEGRYIKRYDINGKAVYGYVYARSYTAVKEKLAECRTNPQKPNGSSMLLSQWLDLWLETADIKDSTKQLYHQHIKNNIVPKLGKIQLKRLNEEKLQEFVQTLDFAPSTVRLIFSILKSSLMYAEDKNYITNIWSKVKLPKKIKSDIEILTPQEQSRLEKTLSEQNDIGILICLYMGLRIGELCALKWSEVDFENSVIRINATQSRIDGELRRTSPKSNASNRVIPIPDILLERLKLHKNNSEYVLSHKGGMVDVRTYRRRFKRLLYEAGLPDIRFHALRHTFASRALEVGMDYKTLSEILGHASVGITMDLYVHSLDEHKKKQMNKLCGIFGLSSN